jgi:ABC-type glycerol-3-phosphate transport system substrate-binding protein
VDVDGGLYLLPSGYHVNGIYYNKTIMEENGWEVPTSMEEMEALLPKIEAAGYIPATSTMNVEEYPFHYFFALGNTVWFNTLDGIQWKENFPTGNSKAMGQGELLLVAQYFQRWVNDGMITKEHTDLDEFEQGKSVFLLTMDTPEFQTTAEDGTTYEYGIMPWISANGNKNMLLRSVSKYYGINKHLEEQGNEQKLKDAIHVIEFLSTEEGMKALMGSDSVYVTSLADSELPEDHPYYEVHDLLDSGRVVSMVHAGWENLIIPFGQVLNQFAEGQMTAVELL